MTYAPNHDVAAVASGAAKTAAGVDLKIHQLAYADLGGPADEILIAVEGAAGVEFFAGEETAADDVAEDEWTFGHAEKGTGSG